MNKSQRPRLCVYVYMPYDSKRSLQPEPHLLLRTHPNDLKQYVKDCGIKVPPFVLKNKAGTFYFGLETDAQLLEESNSRRWNGAFGTKIEEFFKEHLAPFFERQTKELVQQAA